MSGKKVVAASARAVPTSAVSQKAVSHKAAHAAGMSKSEASARWAALDSRHERLVTASDAVLADVDRKGGRRMAS